jgi:hypothetical protein
MARCDTCGNDYDKPFVVMSGTNSFTFDSFECAIQKLAPTCAHCKCRIIGHGLETTGRGTAAQLRPQGGVESTRRSYVGPPQAARSLDVVFSA